MRTKLVNGGMLADLCGVCGLEPWIIISKQIEENAGRSNRKILEDVFEAFLGAMYMDQGYEHTRTWLVNFIESNVDFTDLIKQQTNYKDMLSKYFQHTFNCMPRFADVPSDSSEGSSRTCTVCIKNRDGLIVGTARAANKKLAENEAAKQALQYYGQV
jgi:ribonuclease-3